MAVTFKLCYYLESQESKPCRIQPFTDLQFGKDLKQVYNLTYKFWEQNFINLKIIIVKNKPLIKLSS
jgi:hypothetical protein